MRAERRFADLRRKRACRSSTARASSIESLHGQTRLGIVSRASRAEIDATLALAQLDHAFEFIIADDDAVRSRSHRRHRTSARSNAWRDDATVIRGNVVALEDGAAGIRSAKAAGLRCAVVGSLPVHLAVERRCAHPVAGRTDARIDSTR